jgi:hypothetical protein
MKKLLYLGIILMLGCGPNEEEVKEGGPNRGQIKEDEKASISTIKIGNLEVMTEDLGLMDWDAAKIACAALGDGWRLPTRDELNILYENKVKFGGFASNNYWSSTEYDNSSAWIQTFFIGIQIYDDKLGVYYVRAVRTF